MILAAGLSPAWQQILVMDEFHRGEVNRARQAVWCSSGKVTNVALAVHALGGALMTLTVLGGDNGEQIRREFESIGLPLRSIQCTSETRVCTTVIEERERIITEFVENARPLTPSEYTDFMCGFAEEVLQANIVVLTGSIPPGVPTAMFAECLEASHTDVRFVLDIRGGELLHALPYRPFLVKPNREELSRTVDREIHTEEEIVAAMRELNMRGAQWVLISQGGGTVLLTSLTEFFRFHSLDVPVINPIGCGDCLAAGLAFGLDRGMSLVEAVRIGIAAAADNAGQLLPSRLDLDRVQERAQDVCVDDS
ncbi:MAG: 1-phosphofructokinase family hexose kinase [Planctomycetota bacterium]|nr:1-phosphofructokinase family hexose kinase [Planctomycetota bacterium]MDA1211512.1 1-phosphofructokinase family hexose kinase [Planctomycetota bacterium]